MKLSIITILFSFLYAIVLQAGGIDIDAQIARIEQASEADRFRLVNELKQQIAKMNANQQAKAIAQYQQETLKAQQQANFANEIIINNQIQKEQDRQTVVPPVKTMPTPIEKPIDIPTEQQKVITKPSQQEQIPTEKTDNPVYQPPVTKDPLPINQPNQPIVENPIVENPIVTEPIVEKPTYKPPVQEIQTPQETFVEEPKKPEPVYVPPTTKTTEPKVEPVEVPTYTAPTKPTTTKPSSQPSFSKGRF